MIRGLRHLGLSVAIICLFTPATSSAQFAVGLGYDGGVTFSDAPIEFVEQPRFRNSDNTSVALGVDIGFSWEFSQNYFVGLAIEGSLYQAGAEPSTGLDFLVGPKLTMKPLSWLFLDLNVGPAISSFDDFCAEGTVLSSGTADCDPTRPSEPAAVGLGASFSTLATVFRYEELHLLVGPTVRYRRAGYDYEDASDGFLLQYLQATIGVRMLIHVPKP